MDYHEMDWRAKHRIFHTFLTRRIIDIYNVSSSSGVVDLFITQPFSLLTSLLMASQNVV